MARAGTTAASIDAGYLSADLMITAPATWGIALTGPLLADTSAQARPAPMPTGCTMTDDLRVQ
jgi:hypothetical protein